MLILNTISRRAFVANPISPRIVLPRVRLVLPKSFQQRCYAVPTPPKRTGGSPVAEELKKQARAAAAKSEKKPELAAKLVVYHAGPGATTFLAMMKITSLLVGAFFTLIVVPAYIKAEKPPVEIAGVAACSFIPIVFVLFTTAPFVTHIYLHLPAAARVSRAALERFVRAMPPSTELTVTTMSAIGKPRYSTLRAADLIPTRRRFGVVNYTRDTAAENAGRKWYNFHAVGQFHIRDGAARKVRYQKKTLVEAWIWDAIKDKIAKRSLAPSS